MATNIKTHRIHYSGIGAPQPSDVFPDLKNNNTYEDTSTNTLYRFSTNGWVADLNIYGTIPGPQGVQGETPFEYVMATTGVVGSPATSEIIQLPEGTKVLKLGIPVGATGAIGITGPQGPIGPQGIKGDTGPQGIPGSSGSITKFIATTDGDITLPSAVNFTGLIVIVNLQRKNLRLVGAPVNGVTNCNIQESAILTSDNTQFIKL